MLYSDVPYGILIKFVCFYLLDIDECSLSLDNCHEHATCVNTNGSFLCSCNLGYYGNGVLCSGKWTNQGGYVQMLTKNDSTTKNSPVVNVCQIVIEEECYVKYNISLHDKAQRNYSEHLQY